MNRLSVPALGRTIRNGRVMGWGTDSYGGLGKGLYESNQSLDFIPQLRNESVKKISSGWSTNLALTENGSVWQWGFKPHQRGLTRAATARRKRGSWFPRLQRTGWYHSKAMLPQLVEFPEGVIIESIDTYAEFASAISTRGELFTWGSNFYGMCGFPEKMGYINKPTQVDTLHGYRVVQVSCGFYHILILTADGEAWACGRASTGAIGITAAITNLQVPQTSVPLFEPSPIQTSNNLDHRIASMPSVQQVVAGFKSSYFLDVNGKIWSCGGNAMGELGHDDFEPRFFPMKISGILENKKFIKIASGHHHVVALGDDGTVYSWGSSKQGQCGRDPAEAIRNPDLTGRRAEAATQAVTMFPGRLRLPSSSRVIDIDAGFSSTILYTENGETYIVGGEPDSFDVRPARLLFPNHKIAKVTIGLGHGLIIT